MYNHIDSGAATPLLIDQELLTISQSDSPNRAISVAVYSEFHAEVEQCLKLSSHSDVIAQRSIARYVENGSVKRAAQLRWLDYAAGVRGGRFGSGGPVEERSEFVSTVMQQVGSQIVTMLLRLWDESQPLAWDRVSEGATNSLDIALGRAIYNEALALEDSVARIRAQRGSFLHRGRPCDPGCSESHFGSSCVRCGQDYGLHSGHTCQSMAQVEDA
jgi:hypothetical protein